MPDSYRTVFSIGFDKYGDPDLRVHMGEISIPIEKMQKLRAMIPPAIAELETLWAQYRSDPHPAPSKNK